MRRLRYIPEGGGLVEVTCRTIHSRFLLRPSPELNDLVVGVLGRAQQRYKVRCCAFVFLSNHFHLLAIVDDALQLARFMGFVNSKLAKEVGRLTGWREKIWGRRYQAIPVSQEEGAQIERLAYILSHGIKEGLVGRAQDWPGVHCARALLEGMPLQGYWFDRTQEYAARRRREDFDRLRYATLETLHLSPLPCWEHLPDEEWRKCALALITGVEEQAADRRSRTGSQPLGASAVRGQHPQDRPARTKRSPAPLVHAASAKIRREFRTAYAWFVAAFREATEKLRAGNRAVLFPAGSFPPGLRLTRRRAGARAPTDDVFAALPRGGVYPGLPFRLNPGRQEEDVQGDDAVQAVGIRRFLPLILSGLRETGGTQLGEPSVVENLVGGILGAEGRT